MTDEGGGYMVVVWFQAALMRLRPEEMLLNCLLSVC